MEGLLKEDTSKIGSETTAYRFLEGEVGVAVEGDGVHARMVGSKDRRRAVALLTQPHTGTGT